MTTLLNTPLVAVLADTQIIDNAGALETFDDINDRNRPSAETMTFQNKRVRYTALTSLSGILNTETAMTIQVELSSGETISCLPGSRFLTSCGEWVKAENLDEDGALRTLVYNPSHRHPQICLKKVKKVERVETLLIPEITFNIKNSDNILVAAQNNVDQRVVTLLPFKPLRTEPF